MTDLTMDVIDPTVRIANYIRCRPGMHWGPREIMDYELIYVVEGELHYHDDDQQSLIEAGQVLVIEPNVQHLLRESTGKTECQISCIHGELLPGSSRSAGDYHLVPEPQLVTSLEGPTLLHDLFVRCSEAFAGYGPIQAALARTIAKEIWLRLGTHWKQSSDASVSSRRMAEMVAFVRENLQAEIGRQDLADAFRLTPEHINFLFRKELNTTPVAFINRERVLLAYQLIQEQQLSVKEAAARVGFHNTFYFSRTFKRIAGISPSQVSK